MRVKFSRARLIRPDVPFPDMVVSRAIPGDPILKIGDHYPNPGKDKRARMRAALYVDQRRLVSAPAPPEQPAAPATPTKKRERNDGLRKA